MSSLGQQHGSIFELEFPRSVQVFDSYADAQKAVDFLADNKFEVKNLCIVGTNLKSVERVLGRKSWRTVMANGAMSGIGTGLLLGVIMLLFVPGAVQNAVALLLVALVLAVAISIIFQAIGYAMTGGQRDFTSVTQTVATQYELLCEHKLVQQAKELLATMPGARAAMFTDPPRPVSSDHDAQ